MDLCISYLIFVAEQLFEVPLMVDNLLRWKISEQHDEIRVKIFSKFVGADPNARDSLDRSALVIAFIILELDNIHSATNTSSSTSDVQQFPSSLNAPSKVSLCD